MVGLTVSNGGRERGQRSDGAISGGWRGSTVGRSLGDRPVGLEVRVGARVLGAGSGNAGPGDGTGFYSFKMEVVRGKHILFCGITLIFR